MLEQLTATYQDDLFIPQDIYDIPDNAVLEFNIKSSRDVRIEVIDPEAREQILKTLVQKMRQTYLKTNSRRRDKAN